jgi:hypothetical protein
MKITARLTLPVALFFMVGCALGQDIHYNYDRGTNFQSYRTYQWGKLQGGPPKADVPAGLPNPPAGFPNPPSGFPNLPGSQPDTRSSESEDQLLDQDIKRAVEEQLAQKGLTKVDKNADIQVSYQAAVREEKRINLSGMGGMGAWGADPGWSGFDSVQGQTSTIPIGTLVVGLYDSARKQMIWRGDASKTVALKKDPDKNYQTLTKAIAKLFRNYPPPPNK